MQKKRLFLVLLLIIILPVSYILYTFAENLLFPDAVSEVSAPVIHEKIIMYAADGRTLEVLKEEAAQYNEVGWYYNRSDTLVKMYDKSGKMHSVLLADIPVLTQSGYKMDANENYTLVFADDGRTTYVPDDDVVAFTKVGWFVAGRSFDPKRPMVAVTYDDGPGPYTDSILSVLEKYNVRATFFAVGSNIAKRHTILKRAVSLGCEIGNHTWNHINLKKASLDEITQQITSTNDAIYNAIGAYPTLYRPTYGSYNESVLSAVPMPAILWSIDTLDWKTRNAESTINCIANQVRDGSIILMHDIHQATAVAAEGVIKHLLKQGYQLVTVSELLSARYGEIVNGKKYYYAY